MWRRLGTVLTAFVAAFAMTGAGSHRPVTSGPENAAAADAVMTITTPSDETSEAAIPADFAAIMGYRPEVGVDATGRKRLIKPSGTCSSPMGDAWSVFESACQSHDLGYDLLRYAAATGGELGQWARRVIDDQFAAAVFGQCAASSDAKCELLATSAVGTVRVNSWRQGHGVPVSEDGASYVIAAMILVLAVVMPLRKKPWRALPMVVAGIRVGGRRTEPARALPDTAPEIAR